MQSSDLLRAKIGFIEKEIQMVSKRKPHSEQQFHRASLSASQLFQVASQGRIELGRSEKDRLSSDYLFVLAVTNKLRLTAHDRDQLRPLHLAHLAVAGKLELRQKDKDRLPTDLLFELVSQQIVGISQDDVGRFSSEQWAALQETEVASANSSLVPI
jgi:hypothetical protein